MSLKRLIKPLFLFLVYIALNQRAYASSFVEEVQKSNEKGFFTLENILLILICGFVVYFFFIKPSKTKHKNAIDGKSTKKLFYYDEIEPDGLIILPENRYRRILEIIPTNISIKSPDEQAAAWEEYRNTIDSISVDWTQIIQTRILRFKDFVEEQKQRNISIKQKYPYLYEHLNNVLSEMVTEYEEHERRERKYFIILKVDAADVINSDLSLSSENAILSAITRNIGTKKKIDDKDLRNIAESELYIAAVFVAIGLVWAGISAFVVKKNGVLDFLNHTFNRDIAYVQDVQEIIAQGVLSEVKTSTTVDDFIRELKLDMAMMKRNAYGYVENKPESEVTVDDKSV